MRGGPNRVADPVAQTCLAPVPRIICWDGVKLDHCYQTLCPWPSSCSGLGTPMALGYGS